VAGSATTRASTSFTFATSTAYSASVVVSGTTITFTVNGTQAQYASMGSGGSATKDGLYEYRDAGGVYGGGIYANFQVTNP
jgi:hypothetical protein